MPMSETDVATRLGRVDIFAPLSAKERSQIARIGRELRHDPGKVLASEGESGIGFHLVLEGSAEVDVGGQHRTTLGPGDYFGEISVLDGQPRTATVRVGPDGLRTFTILAWNFKGMLDDHPQVAKALLVGLCARLRAAEARAGQAAGASGPPEAS
jgi:CRP-like cAMP-binding protein